MKSIRYLLAALFICAFSGTGTAQAASVDYQPPMLSISASNEPLLSVLRTIAGTMHISISYTANLDKAVTCRIEKLPVQRAFKNLLGDHNFALQWEGKRVVGLSILEQGRASSARAVIIPAGNEHFDSTEDSQLDREMAAEIARINQEAAAEEARAEQEMMKSE